MRPFWLAVFFGVTLLSLAEFGAPMNAPVMAADNTGGDTMPICTLPKCLNPRVTAKSGTGTATATVEAKVTPDDAAKWCATYKPKDKLCTQEQVRNGWIGFKNLYRASADCTVGRMTPIDGNTYTYVGVWEDGPGKGRPKFTTTNRRFPHTKWDETGIETHPDGTITGWGGGSPNLAAQWEVLCAGALAPAVTASQPLAQASQPATQTQPPVQLRPDQLRQASTETQLQTADFGTPEATAKIAAKAGFVDIVGLKLGTPLKAALDELKAHNPNLVMEPLAMAMPSYEALPGVLMTPLLMSKKRTNTSAPEEKEHVGLLVTMAPSEPFVWGMWREVSNEKEESRPTIETVQAGLRKKYGQESVKDVGNRLIWMYDAQGQQVPAAKANEVITKCAGTWTLGQSMPYSQMQWGYFDKQIVGGYFSGSYGKDHMNGLCQSYSHVVAEYMASTPIGKTSPPLVANVKVVAMNRQLEASGVTASHTRLISEALKLAEKRKGEAEKREVPKF